MTDPALTLAQHITPDLREWLLAELRFPVLGVIDGKGAPNLSAMWFDLVDEPDTILMNTRAGRAKERWLRRDPRCSLVFVDRYTWHAFKGRAELIDDPERGERDIMALARRYGKNPEQYRGQHRVTILLRVELVIRHDD